MTTSQTTATNKANGDTATKAVYLLTQDETVAERDRIEALPEGSEAGRMSELCRHSYTRFGTLLSKLEVTLTDEEGDELLAAMQAEQDNPCEIEFTDENGNSYLALRVVADLYAVTLNATYVLRNSATLAEVRTLQDLLCGEIKA